MRDTQASAYDSIKPYQPTMQQRIFEFIASKPSTNYEMTVALGMKTHSISGCLTRLADEGIIEDSGERRLTDSGRKAIVWRAKA